MKVLIGLYSICIIYFNILFFFILKRKVGMGNVLPQTTVFLGVNLRYALETIWMKTMLETWKPSWKLARYCAKKLPGTKIDRIKLSSLSLILKHPFPIFLIKLYQKHNICSGELFAFYRYQCIHKAKINIIFLFTG